MRRLARLGPYLLAAGLATPLAAQQKHDLRVLYAGNPGSERMADFQSFLADHFVEVGTTDFEKITVDDARPYDVIVFDWTSIMPRDEAGEVRQDVFQLNMPETPKLPKDWDRPSIIIGAAGTRIADLFRSKIDWL